jgi:ligand-binding sensor domain-containing protein
MVALVAPNVLFALAFAAGDGQPPPAAPVNAPAPQLNPEPRGQLTQITKWETFDRTSGLPSSKTTAVLAVGDALWIGTDDGLARIGAKGIEVLREKEGLPHRVVSSLAHDAATGDLWIGTMGGLARWSAGRVDKYTQTTSGLANDVVYDVAARDGSVWAATASGTSRFDTRTTRWEIYDQTNARMHEPWCYAIALAPDSVYLGVWGGGVLQRDLAGGEWREYRDPDGQMEVDLIRDDGLVHDVVSNVSYDDGILWVSTYFGISRYDGQHWRSFSTKDSGLASDFVNTIVGDRGLAFCGTDQGLSLYDGATWSTFRREADGSGSVTVTDRDGHDPVRTSTEGALPSGHVVDLSVRGDDLYVATLAGVAHGRLIRPAPATKPTPAPAPAGATNLESQR